MIIISADKESIFSVNTMTAINIYGSNAGSFELRFFTPDVEFGNMLGSYATKERAKEVLMDIALSYDSNCKLYFVPEE